MRVEGHEKVYAWINARQKQLKNPRPFFVTCAQILSESASKTWNARGRPAWIPRKDDKPHPLMEKTGRLRSSMESTVDSGDAIVTISVSSGQSWLDKGTSVEYGAYHQFGTSRMVARPFVAFYPEDVDAITKEAETYFLHD